MDSVTNKTSRAGRSRSRICTISTPAVTARFANSIRKVRSGTLAWRGSNRRSVITYTSGVKRSRINLLTLPFHLERASSLLEVDNLPYAQQYVQQTKASHRATCIAALHRKRQPRPVNLVGGEHQQIVLVPGRTRDPREDNEQNTDLKTDQNEEDDC